MCHERWAKWSDEAVERRYLRDLFERERGRERRTEFVVDEPDETPDTEPDETPVVVAAGDL
jgi:hypothetical protein